MFGCLVSHVSRTTSPTFITDFVALQIEALSMTFFSATLRPICLNKKQSQIMVYSFGAPKCNGTIGAYSFGAPKCNAAFKYAAFNIVTLVSHVSCPH